MQKKIKKYLTLFLFLILALSLALFAVKAWSVPSVTFLWDANTEVDLAGYRIYFTGNTGEYIYGGNSSPNFLAEIPCPPNDTSCCTWTAPSMSGAGYYYVATAYDVHGFESLPSDEINSLPPGQVKNFNLHK